MRKLLLLPVGLLAALPVFGADPYGRWVNYSQTVMSVTILALVLIVGFMALRWHYKNRYRGTLKFWRFTLRNALVRLSFFVIMVVLLVNLLFPEPETDDMHAVADFATLRHMPNLAEEAYEELSKTYPFIPKYHFEFISAHYRQEFWGLERGEVDVTQENDRPIFAYSQLIANHNPFLQDIGRLGVAMCEYYEANEDLALEQLRGIRSQALPYHNLFMGRVFIRMQRLDSAECYFQREFALGEVPEMATHAFAAMLYSHEQDSLDKMIALIDHPTMGSQVPLAYKRYAFTKRARLVSYFSAVVADWWANIQWIGLIGALLGTVVWMMFLRKVDSLGNKSWLHMVAVFLLGGLFSFLALMLYDVVHWELGFYQSQDGAVGHDFLYCVFGIGVIEELVKILPLLLLMRFTKRVDDPVSYLIYASLSALGFAFVENLMYFDAGHIGIMHGRVLICNVFHMFATSTVAFGMLLARYRHDRPQWLYFIPFFLLAALMHGFYDFWLINESVSLLVFLTFSLFIYATFQYAAYLNNALNHSQDFSGRYKLDPQGLAVFLTIGLVGILLFEYAGLGFVYGSSLANYSLVKSLGMGSFLMFFVVLNLSNIDVVQGDWVWLRFWNFGTRIDYNRAIGQRLRLLPTVAVGPLSAILPMSGEVISRVSIQGDSRYFLFRLDQRPTLGEFTLDYVLLRTKNPGEIPESQQDVEASVIAFRDKEALSRKDKRKGDFKTLDTVRIE